MNVISVRNAHQAIAGAIDVIRNVGVKRDSRNGPVLMAPGPVTTTYERPCERVIFHPGRDANPFFHLFEGIWMLGGRNDLASLTNYIKDFGKFSDDGETLHGAYGHRWRSAFGQDQLPKIIGALRSNKHDRRQVLQMWHSESDLGREGKDLPCNLMITFQIDVDDRLEMTIFCRSNDIILGAYGANAVHFSMLHEYMAAMIGIPVGRYHQISVNWHAYQRDLDKLPEEWKCLDPYEVNGIVPHAMIQRGEESVWETDMRSWWRRGTSSGTYQTFFFAEILVPMVKAHEAFSTIDGPDRFGAALQELDNCIATDWAKAGREWIMRRWKKWMKANDDGPDYPEVR